MWEHIKPTLEVGKLRLKDWLALQHAATLILSHCPGGETLSHELVHFGCFGPEDCRALCTCSSLADLLSRKQAAALTLSHALSPRDLCVQIALFHRGES